MITAKRKERLHPRRHKARPTPVDDGRALSYEQLEDLWAAYRADPAKVALRNRLVEHYLPLVRNLAGSIAKEMRLRDEDDAVGEVLVLLVSSIVPGYDGKRSFSNWARACTRRKLIDLKRVEHMEGTIFAAMPSGPDGLDLVPGRGEGNCDLNFIAFTADLKNQQAMVLWLRYYRGMSVAEVAALLKLSTRRVKACTRAALEALKNQWAEFPWDDLPSY